MNQQQDLADLKSLDLAQLRVPERKLTTSISIDTLPLTREQLFEKYKDFTCSELWHEVRFALDPKRQTFILEALRFRCAKFPNELSWENRNKLIDELVLLAKDSKRQDPVRSAAQCAVIFLSYDYKELFRHLENISSVPFKRWAPNPEGRWFDSYFMDAFLLNNPVYSAWIKLYAPDRIRYSAASTTSEDYPIPASLQIGDGIFKDLLSFMNGEGPLHELQKTWGLPRYIEPYHLLGMTKGEQSRIIYNGDFGGSIGPLVELADIATKRAGLELSPPPELLNTGNFENLSYVLQFRIIRDAFKAMQDLSEKDKKDLRSELFPDHSITTLVQAHFGMTYAEIRACYVKSRKEGNRISTWIADPDEGLAFLKRIGYVKLDWTSTVMELFCKQFESILRPPSFVKALRGQLYFLKKQKGERLPQHSFFDIPDMQWEDRGAFVAKEYRALERRIQRSIDSFSQGANNQEY